MLKLANDSLAELGLAARVSPTDIEVIAADLSVYGETEPETLDAIRLLASSEGLVADPVHEGKALRGLQKLVRDGEIDAY